MYNVPFVLQNLLHYISVSYRVPLSSGYIRLQDNVAPVHNLSSY